jgi:hypothetical protein
MAITAAAAVTYRGVLLIAPQLRKALMTSYKPYCVLSNEIVYLPLVRSADGTVIQRLSQISLCAVPTCALISVTHRCADAPG